MANITVVQNDYITILCDTDHKVIQHTIHKPIDTKTLITSLDAGIQAMAKYGATKWLSDDRLNGELSNDDKDWIFNQFPTRAMNAGWKFWAIIVPHEVAGRASMVDMVFDYTQRGILTRTFTNPADGKKWLESL